MAHLRKILASLALISAFFMPLSASAITPMGGYVTTYLPCNYGILITVVNPGGIGSGVYMWTPATISFSYGPPLPNTWVLGMTDVPLPCFIGRVFVGYGERITFHGTSLPGVSTNFNNPALLTGFGLY